MPALLACAASVVPAGALGHPEDALALVLVLVVEERLEPGLGHAVGEHFGADLLAALGERVGDVLEEDQAEDEVLVLGRVHRAAQLVGGLPQCVVQVSGTRHARQRRLVLLLPGGHGSPTGQYERTAAR